MGHYHNKLDKKYFNKSVYVKKFEDTFNVKIKDQPLQYELLFESYNTLIKLNNILFSTNYTATKDKVDKIINLLTSYLDKYKNKIKKCYDSNCISLYDDFENVVDDLLERQKTYEDKHIKYNLKPLEKYIEQYMYILNKIKFDAIFDSRDFAFNKLPNDKLPKKIMCKLLNDVEKHKSFWFDINKQKAFNTEFINNYFDKTGIDLFKDDKQRTLIFEIHTYIKDINNFLVDYILYQDKNKLFLHIQVADKFMSEDYSCLEDIYYKNLLSKINKILILICKLQIDTAFEEIQKIINENNTLYERIS